MSVVFSCTQCGQSYQVKASLSGKKVKCKTCPAILTIPSPSPPPLPASRTAPPPPPSRPRPAPPALPPDPPYDLAPTAWDDLPPPRPKLHPTLDDSEAQPLGRSFDPPRRFTGAASLKLVYGAVGAIAGVLVPLLLALAFTRGAARPSRSPVVALETAYLAHDRLTTDGLSTLSELTTLLSQAADPATAQQLAPAIQEAARKVKSLAIAGGQLPPSPLSSRLDSLSNMAPTAKLPSPP